MENRDNNSYGSGIMILEGFIGGIDFYEAVFAIVLLGLVAIFAVTPLRRSVKKKCRVILYDNKLASILRSSIVQLVLPSISGVYYLCLDIWADRWSWIKNYESFHEYVFGWLVGISFLALLVRGIADWYEAKSDKAYIAFMERFSSLTSRLVKVKLDRFKEESAVLRPTVDVFKRITQPKSQINLILGEVESLLLNHFGIKAHQVNITIIRNDYQKGVWFYKYQTNRSWKHTKASVLMGEKSAARKCLDTGEPVFFACKSEAARRNEYFLSERDKRYITGSAYCYPVFVKNPDYNDLYLVSIVTYGVRLCDPLDSAQSEAIAEIFTDICTRIDLELTLESIKEWRFDYPKTKIGAVS